MKAKVQGRNQISTGRTSDAAWRFLVSSEIADYYKVLFVKKKKPPRHLPLAMAGISSLFAERADAPASVVAIAAGWGRGGRKIHRDQHGRIGERTA